MDEQFGMVESAHDDYSLVAVTGEVDVATAPLLRDRLNAVIAAAPPLVVVDLLAVSFIDSTALGVLIGAQKRCGESDRGFRLVVSEARILKIFEITGLTDLFAVFPTTEEALTR
jgi:anti-sigma B factor antagonist